jgi:hypothetical protein
MKTLTTLAILISTCLGVLAQNQGPIPKISQQITDYFSFYPKEKVFITTDKQCYKPGETIWFSAIVIDGKTQLPTIESQELIVKLYNRKGEPVISDKFRLNNGSTPGDLEIPDKLSRDHYFLVAYPPTITSPDEIFCTTLNIDPAYSNQWIANVTAKDSISISGQKNELTILLQTLSGEIEKNTALRYQLMNGKEIIGKGKLKTDDAGKAILPFTLPEKSNGEPFIIELTDNKDEWKKEVFLPSNLDPILISFFPEGGTIAAGLPVKIGFTAFNKWGIPVNVEGSVVNQEGKQVAQVKTFIKGLGLFPIENDGKQKLKLVLSGKTGQDQTFELPAPNPAGLAFSVVKTDAEFISVNLVFADKQKHAIALTATNGSSLYWAADMDINGIGRIKIPADNLPQGINQLSVFSNDGKLLAERMVFLDKKQELKVEVKPDKSNLKQGENIKVMVRLTDENNQPLSGNLSISITDNFRKAETTPQIEECLMVGNELETPFSLISEAFHGQITNSALMDVFLISNRQKSFNWQKIMQFNPENAVGNNSSGNSISGFVTDKNGNKINKAKVSLVINKNMQLLTTTTNQNGQFSFANMNPVNKDDFSAKATDPEGKRELNIVLNKNFENRLSDFIAKNALKYILLKKDHVAGEIYINNNEDLFQRAPRLLNPNTNALDNQRKLLSTSTNLLDVIKTIKPFKIMNNQIVFIGSENSLLFQGGALIVLDGQQLGTDISVIQSISLMDIDHINVSTNAMDIHRYTGLNSVGVVEIFLKRAKANEPDVKKESTNQYNGEYRIPKAFQVEITNLKRDLRTTLQWIPELKVDESGQAEITVTAGKVLSDFIIEVQGISTNGRMGSGKGRFSVR